MRFASSGVTDRQSLGDWAPTMPPCWRRSEPGGWPTGWARGGVGRPLSLAHRPRWTAEACECEVNTLAEARRHGHARACVSAWAQAVAAEGLDPIHSALRTNTASLALARSCGYQRLTVAAHVGSAPA